VKQQERMSGTVLCEWLDAAHAERHCTAAVTPHCCDAAATFCDRKSRQVLVTMRGSPHLQHS
jgi:hypothetical protein